MPKRLCVMTVLGLAALAAGLSDAAAAPGEDKVFTVGNYPLQARAADAVTAKAKAIADGQQAAFRSLLKRLVPVTAYGRLDTLRDTKAAGLVAGFAVRSERNSSTEYIASYDFSFQAEAVRGLLEREHIPFVDRQAEPLTIVPVYWAPAKVGSSEAFSEARGADAWLYAWKALDLANALTPASIKTLKPEVRRETIQSVLDGDASALRTMGADLQAGSIMLAVLEPEAAGNKLRVSLAGRDAAGAFGLNRTYRIDGGDLAYTSELAAVVSLGIIEGRWKAVSARSGGGGSAVPAAAADTVRIAVEFAGMAEWQVIGRQLAQVPNLTDLEVEGLSARGARVALRYPGGPEQLASALSEHGLILRGGGGSWVLTRR